MKPSSISRPTRVERAKESPMPGRNQFLQNQKTSQVIINSLILSNAYCEKSLHPARPRHCEGDQGARVPSPIREATLQPHGRVSAVEKVKLKCRAAECPSNGSLYLMEQRSVIRSESFYHNIVPQLIFPLERQVCPSTRLVWWKVRTTPMFGRSRRGSSGRYYFC